MRVSEMLSWKLSLGNRRCNSQKHFNLLPSLQIFAHVIITRFFRTVIGQNSVNYDEIILPETSFKVTKK